MAFTTILQDVRFGLRALRRAPGFTSAALLTLALGIGANSAIFSVVNAVLLRPLPYPHPDRIVQLVRRGQGGEGLGQTGLRYLFYRDGMRSFDAMAAWRSPSGVNLAGEDSAEFVKAMSVSKEFFDVFGVRPAMGEPFSAVHDVEGGADVAILGYALWRRQFGGNPSVVGTTILLGDRPHVVLGVMPSWFASLPPADLYVPLRPSTRGPGGGFNYTVAGRLHAGVSREQANAEAAALFESFRRDHPEAVGRTEYASAFVPYQDAVSRDVRAELFVMLGAVGLLLLIACANTANLLLARASGRGREIAVRAALGAARARIVGQLLTESVLLAMIGGAAGLLLAKWTVPVLLAMTPPGLTAYQAVRIDATVLLVTLAIAVVTGVLFGLAPALSLSRRDLAEAFKGDGTRTTAGRRAGVLRRSLVVGEIALCMLLLVGAGLLVQTFVKLRSIDPGFDPAGVLTARMSLQGDRYPTTADLNRFFDRALERIRGIPGVRSAAVVNGVPIERGLNLNVDILDGPDRLENQLTDWRYASIGYFETMGIPIVAGRGFEPRDSAGAPPVAVVSQQFAKQFFKNTAALGHHIRVFDSDGSIEIVGIARDVREQGLVGQLPAVMYVPITQANTAGVRASHTYFPMSWVVRATTTGPELVREIREQLRAVDPKQPFSAFKTMEEVKASAIESERFQMSLLVVFAAIGLLLAIAGIYGLVAYAVDQRTREFGIRIALGAPRRRILTAVVLEGVLFGAAGVVLGASAAVFSMRALRSLVFGVTVLDPATYVGVAALLVVVACAASLLPAIRAVRLDPVIALRQ